MTEYKMNNQDLSIINESNTIDSNETPSKSDSNRPKQKKSVFAIIVAWLLIIILFLSCIYAFFLHPINKLTLRLALSNNYTIYMVFNDGLNKMHSTVYVDGDYMQVTVSDKFNKVHSTRFFEMDGRILYEYIQQSDGSWERVISKNAASDLDIASTENLLNRKNYKRINGKLFAWEIKDGIYTDPYTDVAFRRKYGKFAITCQYESYNLTIIFRNIGFTKIRLPWEIEQIKKG